MERTINHKGESFMKTFGKYFLKLVIFIEEIIFGKEDPLKKH